MGADLFTKTHVPNSECTVMMAATIPAKPQDLYLHLRSSTTSADNHLIEFVKDSLPATSSDQQPSLRVSCLWLEQLDHPAQDESLVPP